MGGKITLAIRRRFGYNSRVSSAGVMELVDVVDSKSTAGDSVPVRVRSPAPRAEDLRRRFSALFFERAKENPDIKIVVVWPGGPVKIYAQIYLQAPAE